MQCYFAIIYPQFRTSIRNICFPLRLNSFYILRLFFLINCNIILFYLRATNYWVNRLKSTSLWIIHLTFVCSWGQRSGESSVARQLMCIHVNDIHLLYVTYCTCKLANNIKIIENWINMLLKYLGTIMPGQVRIDYYFIIISTILRV